MPLHESLLQNVTDFLLSWHYRLRVHALHHLKDAATNMPRTRIMEARTQMKGFKLLSLAIIALGVILVVVGLMGTREAAVGVTLGTFITLAGVALFVFLFVYGRRET